MSRLTSSLTSRACALASLVVMAVLGAYYFYPQTFQPASQKQGPKSKAEVLAMIKNHHPKGMTEKIRGSISVKIRSLSEFAVNQPLVYVAELTTDADLRYADYRWILPPEIELIQGQLTGSLTDLKVGQSIPIEITVSSVLDENSQIHFQVKSEAGGAQFTASDQYNTVNQPVIDEKIKELHEKTKKASKKEALR